MEKKATSQGGRWVNLIDIKFDHKTELLSQAIGVSKDRLKEIIESTHKVTCPKHGFEGKKTRSERLEQLLKLVKPKNEAEFVLVGYSLSSEYGHRELLKYKEMVMQATSKAHATTH